MKSVDLRHKISKKKKEKLKDKGFTDLCQWRLHEASALSCTGRKWFPRWLTDGPKLISNTPAGSINNWGFNKIGC